MKLSPVRNRILSVLLAACLILPLSPLTVSAEEILIGASEEMVDSGILTESDETPATGTDSLDEGLPEGSFTPMSIDPTHAFVVKEATPTATQLAAPGNLRWDDTTTPGKVMAKWDPVTGAEKYRVYLYKNKTGTGGGYLEALVNTNERDFLVNFKGVGYGAGDYTFRVKAIPATGDALHTESELSAVSGFYTYVEPVCEIGTVGYPTLAAALTAVTSGQTITLLDDIDHTKQIDIAIGKKVTFNLNGFDLNVVTDDYFGLYLYKGAEVHLEGDGEFNVTGYYGGLRIDGDALNPNTCATVTNATGVRCGVTTNYGTVVVRGDAIATGTNNDDDWGVYATSSNVTVHGDAIGRDFGVYADGGTVTVHGNATGELGDGSAGVVARYNSNVTVKKNATGRWAGVHVNESTVTVDGNVVCTGTGYGSVYGAYVDGNSSGSGATLTVGKNVTAAGTNATGVTARGKAYVTVNGVVAAHKHIEVGSTPKGLTDYGTDPEKPGYYAYTDGTNTVWVKDLMVSDNACEVVGDKEYPTVAEAVAAAQSAGGSQTVKLLKSVTETLPIEITGNITFNLDGHTLTIDTSETDDSTALYVSGGGNVTYTGGGDFKVIGDFCSVRADGAGTQAEVTYAETTRDSAYSVQAGDGGEVYIGGDVLCRGNGSHALRATLGGVITVDGAVTCLRENSLGAYSAGTNSVITVKNGVTAAEVDSDGVNANGGGKAYITGNVTAGETGVTVYGSSVSAVVVTGNVTTLGINPEAYAEGVSAGGGGIVTVTGNVTASGGLESTGVYSNGSVVTIVGNVTSDDVGANATGSGTIKIDGVITVGVDGAYVKVGGTSKAFDAEDSTTGDGYREYTDGTNTVWVRGAAQLGKPTGLAWNTSADQLRATWSAVPNADQYKVEYYKDGTKLGMYTTISSPDTSTDDMKGNLLVYGTGGYTFTVQATAATGSNYLDSEVSEPSGPYSHPPGGTNYTVTVNGSYASSSGAGSYASGATVNIRAGNRSGYTFAGWTSEHVTITNAGDKDASFTMLEKNVIVTANWSYSGSSGGGSRTAGLELSTANPSEATAGKTYTDTFTASGGNSPYTYAVTGGSLPPGLSLASNGTLSGTPTVAGAYRYTVTVTDSRGRTASRSFTQVIREAPLPPALIQTEIVLTIGSLQALINNQPYTLEAEPFIDPAADRTLVPIRFISEGLGAKVDWNPLVQQVTIEDGGKAIVLTIGSKSVLVDGVQQVIDCAPLVVSPGRTFVPLRFVSETLGAAVDYDNVTRQIRISR